MMVHIATFPEDYPVEKLFAFIEHWAKLAGDRQYIFRDLVRKHIVVTSDRDLAIRNGYLLVGEVFRFNGDKDQPGR